MNLAVIRPNIERKATTTGISNINAKPRSIIRIYGVIFFNKSQLHWIPLSPAKLYFMMSAAALIYLSEGVRIMAAYLIKDSNARACN
jgi:hypothetical protein